MFLSKVPPCASWRLLNSAPSSSSQSSAFARILANIIVAGSGVLIRAASQAYREAVVSASAPFCVHKLLCNADDAPKG